MSLGFLRPELADGRIVLIDVRTPQTPVLDLTPAAMVQLAAQLMEACAQAFAEPDTSVDEPIDLVPVDYYAGTSRPLPSRSRACRGLRARWSA